MKKLVFMAALAAFASASVAAAQRAGGQCHHNGIWYASTMTTARHAILAQRRSHHQHRVIIDMVCRVLAENSLFMALSACASERRRHLARQSPVRRRSHNDVIVEATA